MKKILIILAGIVGVYAIVYIDVTLRAKEAFETAERYVRWNENPNLKKDHFNAVFEKEKSSLIKLKSKGKISEEEFQERLEALQFDNQFHLDESSLKYAYQWYKDTFELFSPPQSKWVKMARQKAPLVLEQWKQELREKNIPFEDTMFE